MGEGGAATQRYASGGGSVGGDCGGRAEPPHWGTGSVIWGARGLVSRGLRGLGARRALRVPAGCTLPQHAPEAPAKRCWCNVGAPITPGPRPPAPAATTADTHQSPPCDESWPGASEPQHRGHLQRPEATWSPQDQPGPYPTMGVTAGTRAARHSDGLRDGCVLPVGPGPPAVGLAAPSSARGLQAGWGLTSTFPAHTCRAEDRDRRCPRHRGRAVGHTPARLAPPHQGPERPWSRAWCRVDGPLRCWVHLLSPRGPPPPTPLTLQPPARPCRGCPRPRAGPRGHSGVSPPWRWPCCRPRQSAGF